MTAFTGLTVSVEFVHGSLRYRARGSFAPQKLAIERDLDDGWHAIETPDLALKLLAVECLRTSLAASAGRVEAEPAIRAPSPAALKGAALALEGVAHEAMRRATHWAMEPDSDKARLARAMVNALIEHTSEVARWLRKWSGAEIGEGSMRWKDEGDGES